MIKLFCNIVKKGVFIVMPVNLKQRAKEYASEMNDIEGNPVDYSYKENPYHVTYDIESTPDLFTLAMIHENGLSFIFFGDDQFDDLLTDDEIMTQLKKFAEKPSTLKYLHKKSADELDLHLYRYHSGDSRSIAKFGRDIRSIITCSMIEGEQFPDHSIVEYDSWNGSRYDLPLMCWIAVAIEHLGKKITPWNIRQMSDVIIRGGGPDWRIPRNMDEQIEFVDLNSYNQMMSLAVWSDAHVDWGAIAKVSGDDDDASTRTMPPSLKRAMAQFGLDIVIDSAVSGTKPRQWEKKETDTLVDYNFNDVLGTRVISQNAWLVNELKARDLVRRMYPYTSARYQEGPVIDWDKPSWAWKPRDCTAANLAGWVLNGPDGKRPKDYKVVKYDFPVPDPDHPGQLKQVNLLDYILEHETEEPMHPYLKQFFKYFEGKDTTTKGDLFKVLNGQPITHKATINIPYYRHHKPIDGYYRGSTGGAHGNVMVGLHKYSPEEVNAWIRSDAGVDDNDKITLDLTNVIHIDWSSFYPQMASRMQLYITPDGVDRYTNILNYRLKVLKPAAKKLWAEGKGDSKEYVNNQEMQIGVKFVLNNATGAANQHQKYALLPLDNKTLSMRLIGNMFIWTMAQRLINRGAYIISTNTDGVYAANISLEEAQKVVDGYIRDYGLPVSPEVIPRFINRDTSNRMEFDHDPKVYDNVRGRLRHGVALTFDRNSLKNNIQYPLVAANSMMKYMQDDPDWLKKPYDKERLRSYIIDALKQKQPSAWFQIYAGTTKRRLLINGVPQQRIDRVILTKEGDHLSNEARSALDQQSSLELLQKWYAGEVTSLKDVELTIKTPNGDRVLEHPKWAGNVLDVPTDKLKLAIIKKNKQRDKAGEVDCWDVQRVPEEAVRVVTFDNSTRKDRHYFKNMFSKSGDSPYDWETTWHIGYIDPDSENCYRPIEVWKPTKLTNYTSDTGILCNREADLDNFDYDNIDIDAYTTWAAQLLDGWKITGDIPELGVKQADDTVIEKKTRARQTKKSIAQGLLKSIMTQQLEVLFADDNPSF